MATTLAATTLAANLNALYNAITTQLDAHPDKVPAQHREVCTRMARDAYIFARADGTVTHAAAMQYANDVVTAYVNALQ